MGHDPDNRQQRCVFQTLLSSSFEIWHRHILCILNVNNVCMIKACSCVNIGHTLISRLRQILYGHIFYFNLNYISNDTRGK